MSKVYVVQSAEGHYYSKHHEWLTGKEASRIFFGKYKDEALNQLIDITLKDVNLRAKVVETSLNERGLPILEIVATQDLLTVSEKDLLELAQQNEQDSLASASQSYANG